MIDVMVISLFLCRQIPEQSSKPVFRRVAGLHLNEGLIARLAVYVQI
jgi:hypothetical protein